MLGRSYSAHPFSVDPQGQGLLQHLGSDLDSVSRPRLWRPFNNGCTAGPGKSRHICVAA